jgi:hypothetical protein
MIKSYVLSLQKKLTVKTVASKFICNTSILLLGLKMIEIYSLHCVFHNLLWQTYIVSCTNYSTFCSYTIYNVHFADLLCTAYRYTSHNEHCRFISYYVVFTDVQSAM